MSFSTSSGYQGRELMIAVMGATGTGKSTFINLASGGAFRVGDGLISCTSDVAYSERFNVAGRTIRLIDTPGFDDTNKSDIDVLKTIALHLSLTYQAGFKLSGIIYLHRISDFRVGGASRRNFNMLRKLCGEDSLKNILIVTNMWGLVEPGRGATRERELMGDERLFRPVLKKGARMVRHNNTYESAHRILQQMIQNTPMTLQIQRELVEEYKDINQTAAAVELDRELAALVQKHMRELQEVRAEMAEALAAKDKVTGNELETTRARLEGNIKRVQNDRKRLSSEYAAEKRRVDEHIERMKRTIEDGEKYRVESERRLANLRAEYSRSVGQSVSERQELQDQIIALEKRENEGPEIFETLGRVAGVLVQVLLPHLNSLCRR